MGNVEVAYRLQTVYLFLHLGSARARVPPVSCLQSRAWSFACLARFARWANKKERLFEVYLKKLVSKILSVAAIRPVISAKEMPLNYLIITLKYLPFTTSSYFRIVTVAIYELRVTCTLR